MLSYEKILSFLFVFELVSCATKQNEKTLSDYVNRFTSLAGNALVRNGSNENIVFAPLNIFHAFSILHMGSGTETRKELTKVFGFPENPNIIPQYHTKFGNFLRLLQNSKDIVVQPAAAIFVQEGIRVNDSFSRQAKLVYDAHVKNLDFGKAETTNTVNSWISERTAGHIPEFFKDHLNPSTKFLLVSALHFAAKWNSGFEQSDTKIEKFITPFSSTEVKMMSKTMTVPYLDDPKFPFRVIGLPYSNEDFYFYIQLPREEPTSIDFTNNFNSVLLSSTKAIPLLVEKEIFVKIPRLSLSSSFNLRSVFEKFGASRVLSSPQLKDILVGEIVEDIDANHSATIEIDESGTVASAITALLSSRSDFSDDPIEFNVNKPFSFFLYNKPLKMILFAGVVSRA